MSTEKHTLYCFSIIKPDARKRFTTNILLTVFLTAGRVAIRSRRLRLKDQASPSRSRLLRLFPRQAHLRVSEPRSILVAVLHQIDEEAEAEDEQIEAAMGREASGQLEDAVQGERHQ